MSKKEENQVLSHYNFFKASARNLIALVSR